MNAKFSLVATLALSAAVVGATSLLPVVAADKKEENKVSKDLAKPLKAAQDALQAKKYPDALAKLKEAESNPKKTPYDEHVINVLAGSAYARTNDYQSAEKAFEAQANDGFTEQAELPRIIKATAQINYQLKNYDKAIEYGNRAIKGGYGDEEVNVIVGQSYYLKGDYKGTLKFFEPIVESDIKAGRTPKDQSLQLIMSSCVKTDDSACTTKALEKLVTYYPKPDYWKDLLYTLQQDRTQTQSDKNTLQLYRLMSEVDVLARPDDYTEMAQLAMEQGSPGEAQHILEKGFQKGVFADQRTKDKNQRLLDQAKKAAAADEASLPKIEKDADAAPTGDKDVGVGLAYLGYLQYDKASDLLTKGLTKGGVKSEAEARLLLGIAQLKAGHKDDAVKSFHAVKGDPTLERLANLWSLHARQA
ncbi:MAG TPA: tetratricopeptide repeat protein [Steroidobacteraceae bacterium]|nr:tetratricopeptide repeat protein [Steroidobacteraceae bacterium]